MNISLFELLRLLRREVWEKRRLFASLYAITSVLFLVVGWNWPKVYSSSSTILVDQQSILRPLMEGTAVTTDVVDRATIAKEIIFSKTVMEETLERFGWLEDEPSDVEKERLISRIQSRTNIRSMGNKLIGISYSDQDPMRAYKTADFFANEFINLAIEAKQQESRSAYNFIDTQVKEYHKKLKDAEEALKNFKSDNLDASPGTQNSVDARIVELRRRIESTELQLRELMIKKSTLEMQISGEADVTATLSREGQHMQRLGNLQNELEELRLKYHDKYPAIVSIKNQIAEIEERMEQEKEIRENGGETGRASMFRSDNSLYQQLRARLSETETEIETLKARLSETADLLRSEEDRIVRINDVDAKLAELTRDYEVNQSLYNSLLRQRESAYISMNMDAENQGMTFKIQEPASLQLIPKGFRFAHFWLAGLVMSFALPLGVIYGYTFVDQKVRMVSTVTDRMGLPVLGAVYHMNTPLEYNLNTAKKSIITFVILASWLAYGYAAWLKLYGGV